MEHQTCPLIPVPQAGLIHVRACKSAKILGQQKVKSDHNALNVDVTPPDCNIQKHGRREEPEA